ncbi:MAG: hypothetical protein L3J49_13855, partial [Desulfobulbaceae bacterium]|nr:hypothetical protein [Desulfobulbaceae bacterium]
IIHVGIPATGTNIIIPIAGAVVVAIIAIFGNDAVGATNVAMRIESMILIIFYALSAVIGPFVGQNIGAGKHDRIEKSLQQSALFSLIFGIVLALAMAVFAPAITGLFDKGNDIQRIANSYLYILPISYGAYGFTMSSNYNSRTRVAEILVNSDQVHIIRRREDYDDLIRGESLVEVT